MTDAARPEDTVGIGEAALVDSTGAGPGDPDLPQAEALPASEPLPPPSTGLDIDDLVSVVEWAPHIEQLARWRQGHELIDVPVVWLAGTGPDPFTGVDHAQERLAPVFDGDSHPWIITTQTCDLGGTPPGNRHPFIGIAPIVHASTLNKNRVRLARERQAGDLVPVLSPYAGHASADPGKPDWFADLRLEVPISKAVLLDRDPIEGFATEDEYIAFAEMLGYKKRRPALHATLAEDLPPLLDKFVFENGAKKQCFAKVEQVRLFVADQRLEPSAAAIYVLTNGVKLTDQEIEVWHQFQAKADTMMKAHGINLGPLVLCDVHELSAAVYRTLVPVPSSHLSALRYP